MILEVKFTEISRKLAANFTSDTLKFVPTFGEIQNVTKYVTDKYEGDYVVTPKVVEQTMPTQDKVMLRDVTIKSIPFFDVSNTSGGSTVYIGSEV